MKKYLLGLLVTAMSISGMSFATGPDFTSLTSAVDFTTVIAAILLVAAALAGVDIVIKGAKMILAAIRGR